MMQNIKAIGFDLFNTLITVEPHALDEAVGSLILSLRQSNYSIESEPFKKAHHEATFRFLEETKRDGKETHNRYWISAALHSQGYSVPPDDSRITTAVDAYFTAFLQFCRLIPRTLEILDALKVRYRLGLLSNFTHAPAAIDIIDRLGLTPFFDVVLISGKLGYRKPHPIVFQKFVEYLGVRADQIAYVGDDPETDIIGAQEAGLQPIWTTYVKDSGIPLDSGILSTSLKSPDINVSRISTWEDLLPLLEVDKRSKKC